MESIAISVIVPIHNVSQYLESCLKSLQNQAFLYKYEVLLLLDSATEEDKKVVSSFSSVSNFVVYEVDFKDSGKVTDVKFLKPPKPLNPIAITESGILIDITFSLFL